MTDKKPKTLKELQSILFIEYQRNGYHAEWTNDFQNNYDNLLRKLDIAELGLIVTEVSEAMEEIRQPIDDDELFFECADIIIRTLNFMSRKGVDAEFYILKKNERNLKRGRLHGKKI